MPRFVSKCPFCEDNTYKYWHHYGCPSGNGEQIDSDGYITCDYYGCRKTWHLIETEFFCNTHSSWKSFTKKCQLRTLINAISKIDSIDDDFLDELQDNVIAKWNKNNGK